MAPAALDASFLAFRAGTLTEDRADVAVGRDPLAFKFLLVPLGAAVAGSDHPGSHTPPGSVPPCQKPSTKARRAKVGAKPGLPGHSRPAPARIDRRETHQLPACPGCHGTLKRTGRTRPRHVEDLPDDLRSEVVEHTIHRDWCPACQKQVEPAVPNALPKCTLGHRAVALAAWLHYGLGTTTGPIVEVFNGHLQLKVSEGGLTEIWHRLAAVLTPWYDRIHRECLTAPVLHADETGCKPGRSQVERGPVIPGRPQVAGFNRRRSISGD